MAKKGRPAGKPKERITISLFKQDADTLRGFYKIGGYNRIIRRLVAEHCEKIRAQASEGLSEDGEPTDAESQET